LQQRIQLKNVKFFRHLLISNNKQKKLSKNFLSMSNLVRFRELHPIYICGEDILVEFDYADGLAIGKDDWIGLFPAKWTSLEQSIVYKKAPPPFRQAKNGHPLLYTLVFHTVSLEVRFLDIF
jgi:hypothetical protein